MGASLAGQSCDQIVEHLECELSLGLSFWQRARDSFGSCVQNAERARTRAVYLKVRERYGSNFRYRL